MVYTSVMESLSVVFTCIKFRLELFRSLVDMIISMSVCRSLHGGCYYHVHCECYCILSFVTAINQPYCPFSVMYFLLRLQ